ncbi:ATP-binding protein [Chroococcidiopsis sp. CCMEE 29]|uniref:ATP-binding protein n=1 Tax=Chroococcidiopsis sp. CCMEE 29 TaxID=155894 RepID=UPI0020206EBB|nr:ATP-binding protein [Chroococcidiopsis sp. CCMEE 29]
MASIDEIILKSTNPFDNIRSVNFWHKQQQPEPTVDSIHQEAIATIEATLDQVAEDHCTRTLMLDGDPGSGKTYLLGRIKKTLNHKAFFAYIPPFPQTDHIWRHILRYTVDSLVQVPDGQKDSQLMLWLRNVLSAIKQRSIKERIMQDDVLDLWRSDRQKFINKLKQIYKQAGIYNAGNFFGVLHDLTNLELYLLACEWLRGDNLSEESLQTLKVRSSIDTEEAAREILANFSRIAIDTQPIVLCFDQLNSIARLPDGSIALQTLFDINTKIHDEDNNFLVIISINTDIWKQYESRIDQSDKPRVDRKVSLGLINLEHAELLLASRLYSLHCHAIPQPASSIYPLTRQYLEDEFPGSKTNPRDVLILGREIFHEYKEWLAIGDNKEKEFQPHQRTGREKKQSQLLAAFKLKWREDFTRIRQRITRIRYLSSPELIQMLQDTLAALQIEEIKTPLFTGTQFGSYSLGYQLPDKSGQLGVVWTEDAHMNTFFYIIRACQKAVEKNPSLTLRLIRAEVLGNSKNQGYKLFTQIFTGSPHHRITPSLTSVHYLATYHSLVKDAREGDLVIGGKTFGLKNLQALIRESNVLYDCRLLQDLGIVKTTGETSPKGDGNRKKNGNEDDDNQQLKIVKIVKPVKPAKELIELKEFLLDLITTQKVMGHKILIKNAHTQFPMRSESQIEQLIQQLCQEKRVQILDPNAKPEAQLVCLVPKS